jgi:hypothetical protein
MSPKLGFLYRRYLRGSDFKSAGAAVQVEIITVRQVEVLPHPKADPVVKWCMFVKGLPEHLPNGILLNHAAEKQLEQIFGQVDIEKLAGQKIGVYAYPVRVSGKELASIGFRQAVTPS